MGWVERDIDIAGHLARRTGEVENNAVARYGYHHHDGNIDRAHSIVVHDIGKAIRTVGDRSNGFTHPSLGARNQLVKRVVERIDGIALGKFDKATPAQAAGRDLSVVVSASLIGQASVEQEQFKHIAA